MAKTNERGFALVEASAALPILILTVAGVMSATYLFVAQAWLKDAAEEAALCVAEKVRAANCKRELIQKTQMALPIGDFVKLTIENFGSHIVVKYHYQAIQVTLKNEMVLRLPVTKRAVGKL